MNNGCNGYNGSQKKRRSRKGWDRTVQPRKPVQDSRPIIAYNGESIAVERTGEIHPGATLPEVLLTEPSSILVCERADAMLKWLCESPAARIPGWQFKVTPVERMVFREQRRKRPTVFRQVIVSFLGWRLDRRHTHYHYPLDPVCFVGTPLRRIITAENEASELVALLRWGRDVREWANENGLKVAGGSGSLATQLLKDPRFYPDTRRKVPRATNKKARPHLPGNHYELRAPERTYFDAYYLDMTAAHHTCAESIQFPNANTLLARGRFREPPTSATREPFTIPGRPAFTRLITSHGLLLVRLNVPHIPAERFPPPYMKEAGVRNVWVYSNELPMIRELGGLVEGVEAAWSSWDPDPGLNQYARWALSQIASMADERKRWAKPVMLATYGMLAARPSAREYGYANARGGEKRVYMTSNGPLHVRVKSQEKETESPVVNVVHRGMIEAEVRMRALSLARDLHSQGVRVLCLYADSVVIESTGAIPFIPPPWRIKSPMTNLQFFNAVSFASDEVTKLPGIPDGVQKLSLARMMAAATGDRSRTTARYPAEPNDRPALPARLPRFHVDAETRAAMREMC